MSRVTFDYSKAKTFISEHEIVSMKKIAENAKAELLGREGAGNDFLGWIDLPVDYDKEEFARIKEAAVRIQGDSEVLLVIGIGGSYLGARAAIEFLRHNFYNMVSKEVRKTPEIYYVGNSISSTYLKHLMDVIGERDFSVNIISWCREKLGDSDTWQWLQMILQPVFYSSLLLFVLSFLAKEQYNPFIYFNF